MAETEATGARRVTLLQALMRERHLTREQTVEVLDRRARAMGINDFTLSLRQLDRWLAQDVGDPRSLRSKVAEAEFGYQIERLLSAARRGGAGGIGAVPQEASVTEHFGAIVVHLAQIDHELGAGSALGPATEVSLSVLATAGESHGHDRDEYLQLAARCSELVGWLHQDSGSFTQAREWTTKALELAEAGDARPLMPYVLMRRSAVAAELALADEALLFAEAALRKADHGGERALALRQLAIAHALNGEGSGLRAAVDAAIESVATTTDPSELAPYCTVAYIQSEAGAAALTLGDAALAVRYLEPAAGGWPSGQRRDRCLCLARLSLAHARRGNLDLAAATAQTASQVAIGCGSRHFERILHDAIEIVRHRNGSHRDNPLVDEQPSLT